MTTQQRNAAALLIDELTYVNYVHNRRISPSVSVERWRKVYGPKTDEMEQRFQGTTITDLMETVERVVPEPKPKRYRHYCRKCGVTWYDSNEKTHCSDCTKEK